MSEEIPKQSSMMPWTCCVGLVELMLLDQGAGNKTSSDGRCTERGSQPATPDLGEMIDGGRANASTQASKGLSCWLTFGRPLADRYR